MFMAKPCWVSLVETPGAGSQFHFTLRDAVDRDAALNAVIILDGFALITPENTGDEFEDILGTPGCPP